MPKLNEAFWKWFGNSKVVDSHGQPLVVYHGTDADVRVFNKDNMLDAGFYFTDVREYAENYGANIVAAYLRLENPLLLTHEWFDTRYPTPARMQAEGHDGFIVTRAGEASMFVAFSAKQIKAVNNDGTWDADDPDIRSNPFEKPEPPDSNYDPEALAAGSEVEFEHTADPAIAKRIAKDHLDEDPDYYAKLKTLGLNPGDRSMSDHGRETLENPGWVDKIVKQHCAELSAYAQAHGLPMPLLDKCKPSKEFGCGHYGCVMATNDPGIVFKITSDESEAHFIACYMKLRDKLPFDDLKYSGIVDYKAIVGLKESSRRARRVYAIWREEAQNVGDWTAGWHKPMTKNELAYFLRQSSAVTILMDTFQANASQFRLKLKSVKDRAEYFNKVQEAVELSADAEIYDTRGERIYSPSAWLKGTRRLAFYLKSCEVSAELLTAEYLGDRLGNTLGFFLQQGLLLADVHPGNLGTRGTDLEAIITDPGHLVVLKPEWEQVNIEAI